MVLEVGLCVGRVNKRPIGGPYAFFDVSEVQKGTRGVPKHPRHPVKVFVDQFSGKYIGFVVFCTIQSHLSHRIVPERLHAHTFYSFLNLPSSLLNGITCGV